MSANCPDVATLYKCSFFQCSGEVKIIVFHCVTAVCIKQICNFSFIKASQTKVKTEILQFFHFHSKEFFIRLLGRGGYPSTKEVRGSNFCDIAWHIDERTHRVIVLSAIDNLVKGAAGQAVQNFNIACGFDEKTGLDYVPMYP